MELLIKGKSLSERAYEILLEMIGRMKPGENKLPSEDDLAKSMGVSRATIREALKYLMMRRITTTIHGKGTFAHPSVLKVKNRMDINSDFYTMLKESYSDVDISVKWSPHMEGNDYFHTLFAGEALKSELTYKAEGKMMLYGYYFFSYDYIEKEPEKPYKSLPTFSAECMKNTIDYCIMRSRIRIDQEAARAFGLPGITPLHCWEEQIFDIDDNCVGIGEVFEHPDNMEIAVVTKLES